MYTYSLPIVDHALGDTVEVRFSSAQQFALLVGQLREEVHIGAPLLEPVVPLDVLHADAR